MIINTTAPVQIIRPTVSGMKKGASKLGSHARVAKGSAPALSCVVHANNLMSELISGVSVLSKTNEHFLLFGMAGISFTMLFSLEETCSRLDCVRLSADGTKSDRKTWMMKSFSESSARVDWVQACLTEGENLNVHHDVVAATFKE